MRPELIIYQGYGDSYEIQAPSESQIGSLTQMLNNTLDPENASN